MNLLVDIFDTIVDNLRSTGTITGLSEVSGITTVTSVNELDAGESITMDSVDYRIITTSSTNFTVTGTGITATTWKAKAPYYIYGHPMELFNTLIEKDKNKDFKYQKYPLIYLWLDYEKDVMVNARENNVIAKDLIIVIMTSTKRNYKALNRYDNVFVPVLHPLYESLMAELLNSPLVSSDDSYSHTSKDKLYWGKEETYGNVGNIGNDALDAVVVSGLNLRIENCN